MSLALRRIGAAPALRAALIQLACIGPTLALTWLLARAGLSFDLMVPALIQGALAAALTWRLGLARWWLAIQAGFAPLLVLAQGWAPPRWLSFSLFAFMLALYWSTFRTQVPYYPSGRRVRDAFAALLPPERPLRVIDVGSGLGGLALHLAHRRPDCTVEGIELAPLPWLVSRLRAAGTRARFRRGDYEDLDFSRYDAVFAYLSPAAMPALWRKAAAEMRPGALLVSYEFGVPGAEPTRTVWPREGGPALFVWDF